MSVEHEADAATDLPCMLLLKDDVLYHDCCRVAQVIRQPPLVRVSVAVGGTLPWRTRGSSYMSEGPYRYLYKPMLIHE